MNRQLDKVANPDAQQHNVAAFFRRSPRAVRIRSRPILLSPVPAIKGKLVNSFRGTLARPPIAPLAKIPIYAQHTDREGLRTACRFNSELMDYLRTFIKPGISTNEIDHLAYDYTVRAGHTPACLGYNGYPKTVCTSVNDVVCHGIPSDTVLEDGDIVNVDLTTIVNCWHGDQSETFLIGNVSPESRRLVQAAFDALWVGIRAIKPFGRVIDIGRAIYRFAKEQGYEVVREFQGHGLGRAFHQEPGIPHFPDLQSGKAVIRPGTCFTIEPMLNIGTWKTEIDKSDGWTVRTQDRRLSAQFEHAVLMTEKGPEVLTLTQFGPREGHRF